MNTFRIVPISKKEAAQIKSTRVDYFGNQVVEKIATGMGPCRLSLKPFKVGADRRLLFSHSPFEIANAFNQPGPVFISSADVEPYDDVYRFPPEIKADKVNFPLTLVGYDAGQQMVFTRLVGEADIEELISEVFENRPEVAYLHARNAEAGCFICKIERAGSFQ